MVLGCDGTVGVDNKIWLVQTSHERDAARDLYKERKGQRKGTRLIYFRPYPCRSTRDQALRVESGGHVAAGSILKSLACLAENTL